MLSNVKQQQTKEVFLPFVMSSSPSRPQGLSFLWHLYYPKSEKHHVLREYLQCTNRCMKFKKKITYTKSLMSLTALQTHTRVALVVNSTCILKNKRLTSSKCTAVSRIISFWNSKYHKSFQAEVHCCKLILYCIYCTASIWPYWTILFCTCCMGHLCSSVHNCFKLGAYLNVSGLLLLLNYYLNMTEKYKCTGLLVNMSKYL